MLIQPTMAKGGVTTALIADLSLKLFSRWTSQEKLDIVKKGRATPKLASLSQAGKGFFRHFQSMNSEWYPGLPGSEEHFKLYYWECSLFANDRRGVSSQAGYANLTYLSKAVTRHQSTAGDLEAAVLSKPLGKPERMCAGKRSSTTNR